ncbi:Basic proline-rich protein precursor [Labilithrix luteola]|uniref:Basic proline-rich protein n=1 Tax=Labilithrix luteola TaxID=1391654 RepID=A0A0K1QDG4_9BACT|nr:Basic proline-rich protein precursor [Labilithrix luteola]
MRLRPGSSAIRFAPRRAPRDCFPLCSQALRRQPSSTQISVGSPTARIGLRWDRYASVNLESSMVRFLLTTRSSLDVWQHWQVGWNQGARGAAPRLDRHETGRERESDDSSEAEADRRSPSDPQAGGFRGSCRSRARCSGGPGGGSRRRSQAWASRDRREVWARRDRREACASREACGRREACASREARACTRPGEARAREARACCRTARGADAHRLECAEAHAGAGGYRRDRRLHEDFPTAGVLTVASTVAAVAIGRASPRTNAGSRIASSGRDEHDLDDASFGHRVAARSGCRTSGREEHAREHGHGARRRCGPASPVVIGPSVVIEEPPPPSTPKAFAPPSPTLLAPRGTPPTSRDLGVPFTPSSQRPPVRRRSRIRSTRPRSSTCAGARRPASRSGSLPRSPVSRCGSAWCCSVSAWSSAPRRSSSRARPTIRLPSAPRHRACLLAFPRRPR